MTASEDLLARLRAVAFRKGEFRLPDGQVLDEYFDQYALASDPHLLRSVAEEIAPLVPPAAEVLVGLELGGIALTVALSAATGVPAAFLRRRRKAYGTRRLVEGASPAGRRAVLVDDVVRSGAQLSQAVTALRGCAAEVSWAVAVLDRRLGALERLGHTGVELRCLSSAR
jgi:orotate phosphoribosyltransferase